MTTFYGDRAVDSTVVMTWESFDSSGASITRSTDGTLTIYKNGGEVERDNLTGVTQIEDHDTHAGLHSLTIDLSDNTDAGFWASGASYEVAIIGAVIDTQTVNHWIGEFTIATLATVQNIVDAVLDELLSGHVTAGTLGKAVADIETQTDKLGAATTEPTGTPSAVETPLEQISRLHQVMRNKLTTTGTKLIMYDDAGVALWEKNVSDDDTTFTAAEGSAP